MQQKLLQNDARRKHVLPRVYSRTTLHFKTTTGTTSIVPLSLVPKHTSQDYHNLCINTNPFFK